MNISLVPDLVSQPPDLGNITLLTGQALDDWLVDFTQAEIDQVAELMQEYAAKPYKNMAMAEVAKNNALTN